MQKLILKALEVHTFTPNDVLVLSVVDEALRDGALEMMLQHVDRLAIDLEKQLGFHVTVILKAISQPLEVLRAETDQETMDKATAILERRTGRVVNFDLGKEE